MSWGFFDMLVKLKSSTPKDRSALQPHGSRERHFRVHPHLHPPNPKTAVKLTQWKLSCLLSWPLSCMLETAPSQIWKEQGVSILNLLWILHTYWLWLLNQLFDGMVACNHTQDWACRTMQVKDLGETANPDPQKSAKKGMRRVSLVQLYPPYQSLIDDCSVGCNKSMHIYRS